MIKNRIKQMRPFLKWPGNKYRVIESIRRLLPNGDRLVEPFVGSGAVFLNSSYPKCFIAEKNSDLVNIYNLIQQEGEDFFKYAQAFFDDKYNTEAKYYRNRKLFNTTNDDRLKAALFLYLNRHGYNGLCRYNMDGIYNVPYGFYSRTYFPLKELRHFYEKIQDVTIRCWDYKKTFQYIRAGDVVYCDPPYVPLSKTANFTQYGPFSFGMDDQIELVTKTMMAVKRGAKVIISNHNTNFIKELYKDATIKTINVQRNISCNGANRKKVKEVLALFEA